GFAFLRGTLKLVIQLADLNPPDKATMQIDARGIGQSMRIVSGLAIDSLADGGSVLRWTAEATEMRGLVATVSHSLIRRAAEQVIRRAWQGVRRELGEAEPT